MENMSAPEVRDRIGRRLIIFPLPLQGHINPVFQLANILHSRGFSITILHIKLSLKLPRLVLRTGAVCSFLAFAAFPLLIEKGYLPVQDDRLEEPVVELPPLRIKDLPWISTAHKEIATTYQQLYELLENMVKETKASSGLIWNTFQELEEISITKLGQDFEIPTFALGPFHKHFASTSSSLIAEDHSSISWLDKQEAKSVIYVSFGSIAAMEEKDFLEVAWGLANSKHPFLWIVRPGSIRGAEWRTVSPASICHDLLCLLRHDRRCLALAPVLVNSRYVSHVWRVGVRLDNCQSREKIEAAIKTILEEIEGGEMRERALRLKEEANLCLQPGESSYESLSRLTSLPN
ncbi:hypothetical protein ACS0TY_019031 [Phlomoides rotata]